MSRTIQALYGIWPTDISQNLRTYILDYPDYSLDDMLLFGDEIMLEQRTKVGVALGEISIGDFIKKENSEPNKRFTNTIVRRWIREEKPEYSKIKEAMIGIIVEHFRICEGYHYALLLCDNFNHHVRAEIMGAAVDYDCNKVSDYVDGIVNVAAIKNHDETVKTNGVEKEGLN